MRKCVKLWLCAALVLMAPAAFAGPCLPGTLQDYINLGSAGCDIGPVSFADFALASGQTFAVPIAPATVQLTPDGSSTDPSLIVTLNSTAMTGELFESFFRFDVSVPLTLFLRGASASLVGATATEDGVVTLVEDLCRNGSFAGAEPLLCSSGLSNTLIAFAASFDNFDDSTTFPNATFVDVFADFTIDGGFSGSAALTGGILTFSTTAGATTVDEPDAAVLAIIALALMGVVSHRRLIPAS